MDIIWYLFLFAYYVIVQSKEPTEPNIDMNLLSIISELQEKSDEHMQLDNIFDIILGEIRNFKTKTDLNMIKVQLENLQNDFDLETKIQKQTQDKFEELTKQLSQKQDQPMTRGTMKPGTTYIRWGRMQCPQNGSRTVYDGYASGSHYTHVGGSPSMLCLPREPVWGKHDDTQNIHGAYVYGVEYEHQKSRANAIFGKSVHNLNVPCVVCETERTSHILIPGRTTCYDGWTPEYWGYLMAGHYTHKSQGDYHCVVAEPETLKDGYLLYFVEVRCGALHCPPYVFGRELPCVVCTK